METRRNKKIAILAILLVLAIGLLIFFALLGKRASSGQGTSKEVAQNRAFDASLEVDENTPSVVIAKLDENVSSESELNESLNSESSVTLSSEAETATEESDSEAQADDETLVQTEEASTEESKAESQAESKENETKEATSKESETKEAAVNVGTGASPEERVIDFAGLQAKKNAHIYAWVSVPGTNVDYPVLRHPTDDGYYLYHNLNGSSGYPGCIYTENWNSKDWTDPVTVLYGHDMRSTGTMFHQLHKFEKQDFFDKNQYIYIYTPEKTLKYWIFATYVHSNEHLLYNHNFSNKDEFQSFFDTVRSSAGGVNHVRDGVEVTTDSKIIILSTCIKNKPENRYLICGVLQ